MFSLAHPRSLVSLCLRVPSPTRRTAHSGTLLSAQILPANLYVQQRVGSILSRAMILKADQFPSEKTIALPERRDILREGDRVGHKSP